MQNILKKIFRITVKTVRDAQTSQPEKAEFYTLFGFVVKAKYKPIK